MQLLASLLLALAPAPASAPAPQDATTRESSLSVDAERLWERTVTPRVRRADWRGPGRYDAAHVLMLPMHAAFARHYEPGEREFADHIGRFYAERARVDLAPSAQLSWLQYLYLVSRFLVLSAHDHPELVPADLPRQLRAWIEEVWADRQALHWTRGPFQGMGERVRWKLTAPAPAAGEHAYVRAILDTERFVFAIAADLRHYGRISGSPLANDSLLQAIGATALEVYRRRVVWDPGGGWTFQPGVWRDHPHYRHACREIKSPGLRPCIVSDIAEDASHSHRTPLWLRSLAEGEPPGSPARAYYKALDWRLEEQFFARVVEPPSGGFDGWRLRNFMDGRNGIYRWNYRSLGPDEGYGPYELSGVLLHGWWAFLPGERVRALYRELADAFPLGPEQLALYAGPVSRTPRARGVLADGTAELLCRLAAGAELSHLAAGTGAEYVSLVSGTFTAGSAERIPMAPSPRGERGMLPGEANRQATLAREY